jgi:hypothetical protein
VVQAKNTEDATGKVLSHDREWISRLESMCPDKDLNIDLKITLVEESVTEL